MENTIMENCNEIKRINALSVNDLKKELNCVYLYFQNRLSEMNKSDVRDAMVYKKLLYTTMKRCDDAEKTFQLGVHYEKINAIILQHQENTRKDNIKTVLSERVPKQLFDYLYEHGVSEKETLEDEFVLNIVPHMEKLRDVGLVYSSITEECEYYGLTAEGYSYKRMSR